MHTFTAEGVTISSVVDQVHAVCLGQEGRCAPVMQSLDCELE